MHLWFAALTFGVGRSYVPSRSTIEMSRDNGDGTVEIEVIKTTRSEEVNDDTGEEVPEK